MMLKKYRNHILRTLKLICLFSFVLPFISVRSCNSINFTDYTGIQMIQECPDDMVIFHIIAIGIWIVLLGLSFVTVQFNDILRGYLNSGKALLSLIAGCMVVFTAILQFVFDTVIPRTGIILYSTSALFIYLYGSTRAWKIRNKVKKMSIPASLSTGWLNTFFKGSQYVSIVLILALWLLFNIDMVIEQPKLFLFIYNIIIFLFAVPLFLMTWFSLKGLEKQYGWAKLHGVLSIVLIIGTCLWLSSKYM